MTTREKSTQNVVDFLRDVMKRSKSLDESGIDSIIKNFDFLNFEDAMLELFVDAKTKQSVKYFQILKQMIPDLMKINEFYNKSRDIILEEYQKSQSIETKTSNTFIASVVNVLNKIISKTNNFDQVLYDCIVDIILCSDSKYKCPINELLSLLEVITHTKQSILASLLPKISLEMTHIIENQKPVQNNYYFEHDELDDLIASDDFKVHGGLRNLGTTCYLNSTLQQLYNVPEFRNIIFANNCQEKWLKKLQEVFKQLDSTRTTVDPSGFIKNWLWYGEPVNTSVQQDAVEFFQALLDDISNKVPDAANIFKGEMKAKVDGIGVTYHSERNEEFITFPIEVSGHHSLESSFRSFLEPTILEGDNMYCDEKLGKIKASMCHRITKAPKVLVIQLMRFTYSKSRGDRVKVNSKFMFPEILDVTELMEDKNNILYELAGVIVHIGSAHGGHYYSYVCADTGDWICYNDSHVSRSTSASALNSTGGGRNHGSAYMLFYRMKEGGNSNKPKTEERVEQKVEEEKVEEKQENSSPKHKHRKKTKSRKRIKEKPKETEQKVASKNDKNGFVEEEEENEDIETKVYNSLQAFYNRVMEDTDNPAVVLALFFSRDFYNPVGIETKVKLLAKTDPKVIYNTETMKLAIPYHSNTSLYFEIVTDIMRNTKDFVTYLTFLENSFTDMIRNQLTFNAILSPLPTAVELGANVDQIFNVTMAFLTACDAHIQKTKIGLVLQCTEIFTAFKSVVTENDKEKIKQVIEHPILPRIQGAENEICCLKVFTMTPESVQKLRRDLFSSDTEQIEAFVTLASTGHFAELNDYKKMTNYQIETIGRNLHKYTSTAMQNFFVSTKWWVMTWLVSTESETRSMMKKAIYNTFPSAPQIRFDVDEQPVVKKADKENLVKLVDILFEFTDAVAKEIQKQFNDVYYSKAVGTMNVQFNEILTWSIIRADLKSLFDTKIDVIMNMLKRFLKVEVQMHQIVNDLIRVVLNCTSNFKEFFRDQATYIKFLNMYTTGVSGTREGLRNIPEFIMKSKTEFTNGFFYSKTIDQLTAILRPDVSWATELFDFIEKNLPRNDKKVLKAIAESLVSNKYYFYDQNGEPMLQNLAKIVLEYDPSLSKIFVKSKLLGKAIERMGGTYSGDYIILAAVLTAVKDTDKKLTDTVLAKYQKVKWNFDLSYTWALFEAFLLVSDKFAEMTINSLPDGFINDKNDQPKFQFITSAITLWQSSKYLTNLLTKKVSRSLSANYYDSIVEWFGVVLPLLTKESTEIFSIAVEHLKSATADAFTIKTRMFLIKAHSLGFDCQEPISRVYELITRISENDKPSVLKRLLEFALFFPELKENLKSTDAGKVEIMRDLCNYQSVNDDESYNSVDALNLIDIVFGKKQ